MVEITVGGGMPHLDRIRVGDILVFDWLKGEPRELFTGFEEGVVSVIGSRKDSTYHGTYREWIDCMPDEITEFNRIGSRRYSDDRATLEKAGIVD